MFQGGTYAAFLFEYFEEFFDCPVRKRLCILNARFDSPILFQVATAIRGAIIAAKLSVVPVRRGYWGNKIGKPHTVPCKVSKLLLFEIQVNPGTLHFRSLANAVPFLCV